MNESLIRFTGDGVLLGASVSDSDREALLPLLEALDREITVGETALVLAPSLNYRVDVAEGEICTPPYEPFETLRTVSTTSSRVVFSGSGVLHEASVSPAEEGLFAELLAALSAP